MRQNPPKFPLHSLNRSGGRRSAGCQDSQATPHLGSELGGKVGKQDEHGWRGAEHGDAFSRDPLKHGARFGFSQTDVRSANSRNGPNEGPPVGVKHRQRPEITIYGAQREMQQGANNVHIGIPMGNHHALGLAGGAARIVNRQQIGLFDVRRYEVCRRRVQNLLIIQPPGPRAVERHKLLDGSQLRTDPLNGVYMVSIRAENPSLTVIEEIGEVIRREPIIEGN